MNNMTIFDLCPDIEEMIQQELNVLLKFREAAKELKLRIKLNEKSIKSCDKHYNRYGSHDVGMPRILKYSLFPYIGKNLMYHNDYNEAFKKVECANIHGFLYNSKYNRYSPMSKWVDGATMDEMDDKLTELGEKRFKSKKKEHKIKLLMKY